MTLWDSPAFYTSHIFLFLSEIMWFKAGSSSPTLSFEGYSQQMWIKKERTNETVYFYTNNCLFQYNWKFSWLCVCLCVFCLPPTAEMERKDKILECNYWLAGCHTNSLCPRHWRWTEGIFMIIEDRLNILNLGTLNLQVGKQKLSLGNQNRTDLFLCF